MKNQWEHEAKQICKAIELLASKPDNLENFEFYLSMHLAEWLKKFANTPAKITTEITAFAEMDI